MADAGKATSRTVSRGADVVVVVEKRKGGDRVRIHAKGLTELVRGLYIDVLDGVDESQPVTQTD